MTGIPPLLQELLLAPGASGAEDAVQAIVRREAVSIGAVVETDRIGSTIATVGGSPGGRTVALVAHTDQVALTVRRAGDDGLLTVAPLANWKARAAFGQRVRIVTRRGEVRGVVVGPLEDAPGWDDLRVDIGAASREEALELVRPGDPAVLHGPPETLSNGRVLSGALDDRLGLWVAIETLRRLAASPPLWDVALVTTVQEETSEYGAAAPVESLAPEVAIVVEVTYAGDAPGMEPWGEVLLGGGPTIFRGPVASPIVGEGLLAAAEAAAIPVAIESGQSTWSDADSIFRLQGGIATGIVCVPLRYMHTAGEVAQLSDAEAAVGLLEAYVRSLPADASFLR